MLDSLAIARAAWTKPVHAVRARAEPTLTRRTPMSASSVRESPALVVRRMLTGFGRTAETIASMSALSAGAGSVENIGACLGVGREAADGFAERIGMPDEVALCTCGKQNAGARGVDGGARGFDSFNRERQIVERLRRIAGGVLDRETRDPGGDAEADVFRDGIRLMRVAGFEVGVDGKVGNGCDDAGDVLEGSVAGDGPFGIGQALGKGEAGAGGGEGFEAKRAKKAGGANVPWVGDDEETRFVQLTEGGAASGEVGGGIRL